MTPRQVAALYLCERDDKGQVVLDPPPGDSPGERALYLKHLYAVGITDPARQELLYRAHRLLQRLESAPAGDGG